MSTDKNIRNAVQVLTQTYRSVQKLLNHCWTLAEERGYLATSDKFLRWRSDQDPAGWLVNSIILPFQWSGDPECVSGNGARQGPTYGVEVFLGSCWDNERTLPAQLYVARYDFEDVNDWASFRWSPAEHWIMNHPLHGGSNFPRTALGDYQLVVPEDPETAKRYYHLTRAVFRAFPLSEVTAENLEALVFDTFDDLAQLELP